MKVVILDPHFTFSLAVGLAQKNVPLNNLKNEVHQNCWVLKSLVQNKQTKC